MSQPQGPWSAPPPKRPPKSPPAPARSGGGLTRLAVWVALVALAAALFWVLNRTYPGQIGDADRGQVLLNFGCLAVVAAGSARMPGLRLGTAARHAAVWLAIVGVAALGYAYRREASDAASRVMGQLNPAGAVTTGPREVALTAGQGGHFEVWALVNGQKVRFLVDTGASDIVLSPDDARRLGYDVDRLTFDRPTSTANGVGFGATVRIRSLEIGPIAMADMPVSVNRAPMDGSLLGMAFLRRLDSYEVRGDRLTLRGRP